MRERVPPLKPIDLVVCVHSNSNIAEKDNDEVTDVAQKG